MIKADHQVKERSVRLRAGDCVLAISDDNKIVCGVLDFVNVDKSYVLHCPGMKYINCRGVPFLIPDDKIDDKDLLTFVKLARLGIPDKARRQDICFAWD